MGKTQLREGVAVVFFDPDTLSEKIGLVGSAEVPSHDDFFGELVPVIDVCTGLKVWIDPFDLTAATPEQLLLMEDL